MTIDALTPRCNRIPESTPESRISGLSRCLARVERQLARAVGSKRRERLGERIAKLREVRERLLSEQTTMQTGVAA